MLVTALPNHQGLVLGRRDKLVQAERRLLLGLETERRDPTHRVDAVRVLVESARDLARLPAGQQSDRVVERVDDLVLRSGPVESLRAPVAAARNVDGFGAVFRLIGIAHSRSDVSGC